MNQTRSDEPGKITAYDAPPILLLVVQDKRLHDEGCRVVLGIRYPRIDSLETGMITSRCYILESHAHPRPDNTVLILRLHSRTKSSSDHLAVERQL